ncbi:MAG: hypothetical protein WCA78_16205 [Rhizomicrobium sp.]
MILPGSAIQVKGFTRADDALPEVIARWSLICLREQLVKIGANVVTPVRYVTLKMAEVAVPRGIFSDALRLIAELRLSPTAAPM